MKQLIDQMSRKAMEFSNVFEIDYADFEEQLDKLTVIRDTELYGRNITKADSPAVLDFVMDVSQWFILETDLGLFVVDHEGYCYARYIAKLA